jgi:geranylgeranyl pyrophosphate synthase
MNSAVKITPVNGLRQAFQSNLRVSPEIEQHLAGALNETLRHPGNMIRAELAFRIARCFALSEERSESLAIAMEYFHTASLLFDDLPCMDNADRRRGATCVHRSYGEGAAILAALALINRAYGLLWTAVSGLPGDLQTRALNYVELHLGLAGLLNGQSRDLYSHNIETHPHLPQQIAMGKTVSLIRMSMVTPALLGGASSREVCLIERLAMAWGLGYQILDDLKDVLHTASEGGKTPERDAEMNRPNLALTIGVAAAFQRASRLIRLSDRMISRLAACRASLSFLQETRERFQIEMAALSQARAAESL